MFKAVNFFLGLFTVTTSIVYAQINPNKNIGTIEYKSPTQTANLRMCLTNDFEEPSLPNAVVSLKDKTWPVGSTIKVSFMGKFSIIVAGKIAQYAREWEKYANVKFEFVKNNGDIRISFEEGGSWSKIGVIAKYVDESEPTMNFGWFTNNTSETEFSRTTLHEFGHALGLKHEHQSPAGSICWDWDKVIEVYGKKPNEWSEKKTRANLTRLSNEDIGNYTKYDPRSIMHYSISNELTSCDFSVNRNTTLSYYDKKGIANLYPKSGSRDPIGNELHTYKWSTGRDNNLIFHHRNKPFLFTLKSATGDVTIHQILTNGSIGSRIFNKKWSAGWTSAASYNYLTKTYLFLLKKSTGDVHVHKLNDDGSVGAKLHDYKWSSGWDHVQIVNKKYLLLYKSSTGDVHIHKINSNGSIGTRTYDAKWGMGWNHVKAFKTNYVSYVLLANNSSGNIRIKQIDKYGKYNKQTYRGQLRKDISLARVLSANNQIYLFNYYKNAQARQNFITAGGTLGEEIGNKQLKTGWTTAEFFYGDAASNYRKFLFLLNKNSGEIVIRKINKN